MHMRLQIHMTYPPIPQKVKWWHGSGCLLICYKSKDPTQAFVILVSSYSLGPFLVCVHWMSFYHPSCVVLIIQIFLCPKRRCKTSSAVFRTSHWSYFNNEVAHCLGTVSLLKEDREISSFFCSLSLFLSYLTFFYYLWHISQAVYLHHSVNSRGNLSLSLSCFTRNTNTEQLSGMTSK